VPCRKGQSLSLALCEKLELIPHALARKIDSLKFDRAPVEGVFGRVDKNVVDSANKVATLNLIDIERLFGAQPIKEADLAENDWVCGLEKCFANPAEDGFGFQKAGRACGYDRACPGHRPIGDLLIESERTDATLLVARRVCLEGTRRAGQGVPLVLDAGAVEAVRW